MSAAESHARQVLSVLNQQRALGKLCDAALSTGEGLVRLAHRNVLACFSDMFLDVPNTQDAMVVSLPDCPEEGLELLLDFIYTGELRLDKDNCGAVQLAAAGLRVADVSAMCRRFTDDGNKRRRGRPKKDTTSPSVGEAPEKQNPAVAKGDEEELAGGGRVATTTRYGRVVNCPRKLQGQDQEALLLLEEAESDRAGECETPSDYTVPLDPAGHADDPDFDDSEENLPDPWDHAHPETPEKKRTRRRRAQTATGEEGGRVQCPVCDKSFKSKYYLKVHNRRHTGEKPFVCGKCGKRYFRKENLQEHEARNCGVTAQVHKCSTCTETFSRKSQLTSHMVTHTGVMPYQCSVCSEQFMQKKNLNHHMMKLHGFPKPHACPECDKSFMSKSELRIHDSSKHKGEKPFVCEECGLRATSRNGLKVHIKAIHRHDKPFVCGECGHAFTQKNNLNMHLLVHSGERPFQCHLCGKTFRTQGTLDKHNRTHTGERPFACDLCQQRFTEKGALTRHVESKHQEARPHPCNVCGRAFKGREQLRVHLNRHKGVRKFECKDCGYKFTRQAHLRRHSLAHKRNENYNPKQRKFRNIIVDDLDSAKDSNTSAQVVQDLLKKKSKAAKKSPKPSKKSKAAKRKKSARDDLEDLSDHWFSDVSWDSNYDEGATEAEKKDDGSKTRRATENLPKSEALESTVSMSEMSEIMDATAEGKD